MARYSFVLAVIAALLVSGAAAECALGDFGTGECLGTQISSVAGGSFGYVVNSVGDINGDGMDDFAIGAPNIASEGAGAAGGTDGEVSIVFGTAAPGANFDKSQLDGTNGFTIVSKYDGARCGYAIGALGDFNGDGIADFGFGCDRKGYVYAEENPTQGEGVAYIVYGKATWNAMVFVSDMDETDGAEFIGASDTDRVGVAFTGGEDINGDGHLDVAIGALYGESVAGYVCLLFGSSSNLETFSFVTQDYIFDEYQLGVMVTPDSNWGKLGHSLKMGDFNADGKPDLIIGNPGASWGWNAGWIWVLYGTADDAVWVNPTQLNDWQGGSTFTTIRGPLLPAAERKERSVATYEAGLFSIGMDVGDVNGDGVIDIVASSPVIGDTSESGAVFVVFGTSNIPTTEFNGEDIVAIQLDVATADQAVRFNGAQGDTYLDTVYVGHSPEDVVVGDFNGDGFADFAYGTYYTGEGVGAVGVVYGKADTSAWKSVNDIADFAETMTGLGAGAETGWGLGKVMNAGKYDLLVGSPGVDTVSRVVFDQAPLVTCPVKAENVKKLVAFHDDDGAHLSFKRRDSSTCEQIKVRLIGSDKWVKIERCGKESDYLWSKTKIKKKLGINSTEFKEGEVEYKIQSKIKATEECPDKMKSSGKKIVSAYRK